MDFFPIFIIIYSLLTFAWEILLKNQEILSAVIISVVLMTCMHTLLNGDAVKE